MVRIPDERRTAKNVIDLTHAIHENMPFYPGTEAPAINRAYTVEKNGFAESRLSFFTHTGTHMDAPAHIIAGGKSLDDFDVSKFMGAGTVVELKTDGVMGLDALREYETDICSADFVLLRSGWHEKWGSGEYYGAFPVLSAEAARWLSGTGIKGVGTDCPSVDPVGDIAMENHLSFLSKEVLIIENLTRLDMLPRNGFIFQCLPLPIESADGSPVRAVAFVCG